MSESSRIGIVIRELRRQKQLTQEEFSRATDRSIDAISQIERGVNSPSVDTLLRFAKALNVPPETLLIGVNGGKANRQRALASALAILHRLTDRELAIAVRQLSAFIDEKDPQQSMRTD